MSDTVPLGARTVAPRDVPDERPVVLIVNHNKTDACGVYQMGKRTAAILAGSQRYRFVEVRCDSYEAYQAQHEEYWPCVVIFNYYPGTMDWANHFAGYSARFVGTVHEITHQDANTQIGPFKRWIVNDPSFPESSIYFKTVRPLPGPYLPKHNSLLWFADPDSTRRLTIGSYGFALPGKGFEYVIDAVAEEFWEQNPLLRLHIPPAMFSGGFPAEQYQAFLAHRAQVQGVECQITTDFKSDEESLAFLAGNHFNCLFYGPNQGRGISSAADYCIASGRPLAITKSEQFRHIGALIPPWPRCSLRTTLYGGQEAVEDLQQEWSHERFIADYEGIVDSLLGGGG